jgi:predicted O-methyltransferase YrrM
MLEKLGTPGHESITKPDYDFVRAVKAVIESGNQAPVVAEIGVGIGATTIQVAELLKNRGEIHIFDFAESVDELSKDLAQRGFTNVTGHGNSKRYWDSYHWSLAKLIASSRQNTLYDVIYIDGAHTYLHDALAFFMCDRLLKVGGSVIFDDYAWRYADSRYMRGERDNYMTKEQIEATQIKMFIDDLVATHVNYETVVATKVFRKVRNSTKNLV